MIQSDKILENKFKWAKQIKSQDSSTDLLHNNSIDSKRSEDEAEDPDREFFIALPKIGKSKKKLEQSTHALDAGNSLMSSKSSASISVSQVCTSVE